MGLLCGGPALSYRITRRNSPPPRNLKRGISRWDGKRPTARRVRSPPPADTPPIPRRGGPIPPLRIAARYAAGITQRQKTSG